MDYPRYYRYFSTETFNSGDRSIRNHNHLLGNVEGVDGIKTGYTHSSGFNLVTSMRRGNRHLVGVVLGGRSGGSRDAMMRDLLAENLEKAASKRTVAAMTEHDPAEANADVAEAEPGLPVGPDGSGSGGIRKRPNRPRRRQRVRTHGFARIDPCGRRGGRASAASQARARTVYQSGDPGSGHCSDPRFVRADEARQGEDRPDQGRTVKLASAGADQSATPVTSAISSHARKCRRHPARSWPRLKSDKAEPNKVEVARTEMPPQPANHGTGNGLLGVLPASSASASSTSQALAYADANAHGQPQAVQQNGAIKPMAVHTGWIIQVGALESESEARQRIEVARDQAHGLLSKADPFTEPVVAKGERKLFRARFAGLDSDQAEAVCRTLKRSDVSCFTVRN